MLDPGAAPQSEEEHGVYALRESPEPPAFRESMVLRVFIGPQGLRAGWAILLFAVLCYALTWLTVRLLFPFLHWNWQGPMPPWAGIIIEASQLLPVIAATALLAVLERRPLLSFGFQGTARALRFLFGLVWGFAGISVLVLLLWKLGFLAFDGRTLAAGGAFRYAAKWGCVFLLTGICEESLFRGYAQYTITRGIGFWWGALLFALLFGAMHSSNAGETPVGLLGAGLIGLVLCLSLWYTGSLWWAVGFHAAWDWGESYFYGVADSGMIARGHLLSGHPVGRALWSGGGTGPEGSVLTPLLVLLMGALMVLWWGKRVRSPFAGAAWKPMRLPGRTNSARPS